MRLMSLSKDQEESVLKEIERQNESMTFTVAK